VANAKLVGKTPREPEPIEKGGHDRLQAALVHILDEHRGIHHEGRIRVRGVDGLAGNARDERGILLLHQGQGVRFRRAASVAVRQHEPERDLFGWIGHDPGGRHQIDVADGRLQAGDVVGQYGGGRERDQPRLIGVHQFDRQRELFLPDVRIVDEVHKERLDRNPLHHGGRIQQHVEGRGGVDDLDGQRDGIADRDVVRHAPHPDRGRDVVQGSRRAAERHGLQPQAGDGRGDLGRRPGETVGDLVVGEPRELIVVQQGGGRQLLGIRHVVVHILDANARKHVGYPGIVTKRPVHESGDRRGVRDRRHDQVEGPGVRIDAIGDGQGYDTGAVDVGLGCQRKGPVGAAAAEDHLGGIDQVGVAGTPGQYQR
jgi:hypothetical protein